MPRLPINQSAKKNIKKKDSTKQKKNDKGRVLKVSEVTFGYPDQTVTVNQRLQVDELLDLSSLRDHLTETNRRMDVITGWLRPFEAVLPAKLKAYLDQHEDTIDMSKITHNSKIRLQKYLFLRRALYLLGVNRLRNLQKEGKYYKAVLL